jgi:lipoprotein-anchoring transpeptidase ErfK/SrfK
MNSSRISRRLLLCVTGLALCAPSLVLARDRSKPLVNRHNIMGFSIQHWQDHFDTLGKAAIVADTSSMALHFWNADGSDYKIYPTSVPRTDELTRRGHTTIARKRVGPDWTPTPSMMRENPDLKYMPPGPHNPLGTHAMYLDWPAYLIHGTHDKRKIGRHSSSGCIGLYNSMVAELFEKAPVGTQVRII